MNYEPADKWHIFGSVFFCVEFSIGMIYLMIRY